MVRLVLRPVPFSSVRVGGVPARYFSRSATRSSRVESRGGEFRSSANVAAVIAKSGATNAAMARTPKGFLGTAFMGFVSSGRQNLLLECVEAFPQGRLGYEPTPRE